MTAMASVLFRRRDGHTFCQKVILCEEQTGVEVFPPLWNLTDRKAGKEVLFVRVQDDKGAIEYRER